MRCLPLVFLIAACSSTPANVGGNYTVAVTNRDNGCNLMNWTVGNSATNIGVTVTQNGTQAVASVNGLVGGYLDVVLGAHDFTGTVDGDHLSLTLFGTRTSNSGNCTWTYNADLEAELNGDILTGTIDYRPKTNGNPDCTEMQNTCSSRQDFNGTRPPT